MKGQFYILAAVIILSGIYLSARYLTQAPMIQPSSPSGELLFSVSVKDAFEDLIDSSESSFRQDFESVQSLVRERSAGSFSVTYNCSGDCPGEMVRVSTSGLSGELNFKFNFSRRTQPVPWWDDDSTDALAYDYRIKLTLSENAGVMRENWPIILTGSDLESRNVSISDIELDSLRLVDPDLIPDEPDEVNGNDLVLQIDHKDGTGDYVTSSNGVLDGDDELVFEVNMSAYEVKDLYLYFSRSGSWSSKSYPSDLDYGNYWVNNSKYFVNYSSDWRAIQEVVVDLDEDGFYDDSSLVSSMTPLVSGSLATHQQDGILSSGPVRVIVESGLYEVNCSDFVGNISRRVQHWQNLPVFKMSHEVVGSNNQGSGRLQVEYLGLESGEWYRVFYPLNDGTQSGGWGEVVVPEEIVPGYFFAHSYDSGVSGFVFTQSPSEYGASEVIQWGLEKNALDDLSRKVWLRDNGSDSSYWESWAYFSQVNATMEPVDLWEGFSYPLFSHFWFEESD